MEINKKIISIACASAMVFAAALPVLAENRGNGVTIDGKVNLEQGRDEGGDFGDENGDYHLDASASVSSRDNERDNEDRNATSSNQERINQNNEREDNESDLNDNEDSEIEIDRDSLASSSSTATSTERGWRAKDVNSHASLVSYIARSMHDDENLDNVHVSTTTVTTEYNDKASLFGIIPVNVLAHVKVTNDGSVSVTYPWYGAFLSTNKQALEDSVTAAINQVFASSTQASTTASLSVGLQAKVLDSVLSAIRGVFK